MYQPYSHHSLKQSWKSHNKTSNVLLLESPVDNFNEFIQDGEGGKGPLGEDKVYHDPPLARPRLHASVAHALTVPVVYAKSHSSGRVSRRAMQAGAANITVIPASATSASVARGLGSARRQNWRNSGCRTEAAVSQFSRSGKRISKFGRAASDLAARQRLNQLSLWTFPG